MGLLLISKVHKFSFAIHPQWGNRYCFEDYVTRFVFVIFQWEYCCFRYCSYIYFFKSHYRAHYLSIQNLKLNVFPFNLFSSSLLFYFHYCNFFQMLGVKWIPSWSDNESEKGKDMTHNGTKITSISISSSLSRFHTNDLYVKNILNKG